jgi:hypothetical protein
MRIKLGSVNLALLSLYFFPVWGRDALRALISPYHGLDDRAHSAAVVYFGQLFDLGTQGLVVAAHVLAGIKLVIAAAFVAYLVEFVRSLAAGRDADRETIDVVLILAVIGVLIFALPAFAFGNPPMGRLYATQMLLIGGAIAVIVVEREIAPQRHARQDRTSRTATAARERERFTLPAGMMAAEPPAPAATALARIPEMRLRNSQDRYADRY